MCKSPECDLRWQKAKLITADHASKSTAMTSKRVSGVEFHFSGRYRRGVYITPAGGTAEVNHGLLFRSEKERVAVEQCSPVPAARLKLS